MISGFFLTGPYPSDALTGQFNYNLVLLSYVVATFASYIALDLVGLLRDPNNSYRSILLWLVGGSFAMGAGIWSMHFIGMLAFVMDMPMVYSIYWTTLSMLAAIVASGFALFMLKSRTLTVIHFALCGVILGVGIATMHYLGMQAMIDTMAIHYIPWLFYLSIGIAIVSSEVAIWLAITASNLERSTPNKKMVFPLKLISALIMGMGICGMHYVGMAAAVFTLNVHAHPITGNINPIILSTFVASITFVILGIAFVFSLYKKNLGQQLMIAHKAGMAEVATDVLHNVGNVLNSINVSSAIIVEKINQFDFKGIEKVTQLIRQNQQNLTDFLTSDPKGSRALPYLEKLAQYWENEKAELFIETAQLIDNIQHVKDIISAQQALSSTTGLTKAVLIDCMLEEALLISGINFERHGIVLNKKYSEFNSICIDKVKVMQIIVNLIRNARDALLEFSPPHKVLTIETGVRTAGIFFIKVTDNGLGIAPETLKNIFRHGFTTKKDGHGFGLHSSAMDAKIMGGIVLVESDGPGKGATFILELPF